MSSPILPINCTKNSPLPAAHLLCDKTLVTLPSGQRIDQKRFAAQRSYGVKFALRAFAHLAESALDCGKLRDVAEMTGHAEILGVLKLWRSQQLIKNVQGASLMGYHLCVLSPSRTVTTLTVSAPMLMPT